MSLYSKVLKQLEADTMETPNLPNPMHLDVWGENKVLAIILPQVERTTKSGIVTSAAHEPISCTAQVIKVSERVTDAYPRLKQLQEQYDPDKTGEHFDGPCIAFAYNGNPGGWPYLSSDGVVEFVFLHADSIRGGFTPRLAGNVYEFDKAKEAA